jgi:transcription termination/antitermination protein NusG
MPNNVTEESRSGFVRQEGLLEWRFVPLLTGPEPAWFAVYVQVNHEKEVAYRLQMKTVEAFVPLQECWSKRRDRRKRLHVPLYPGDVFIHSVLDNYVHAEVVKTPGAVWILRNSAGPLPIPDHQMESLQRLLAQPQVLVTGPLIQVGDLVRVCNGPLAGCIGHLVRSKAAKGRLVVNLDIIQQSVSVELDVEDVEAVKPDDLAGVERRKR